MKEEDGKFHNYTSTGLLIKIDGSFKMVGTRRVFLRHGRKVVIPPYTVPRPVGFTRNPNQIRTQYTKIVSVGLKKGP